jgi:hypothetical protein
MSFDETHLPRDVGEKVAENDLEAEPVLALLKSCSRADGSAERLDRESATIG